jgi:glycosyltransferase involved in cell wall biosynthesis/ribosomal protein S18 acetylase RimI-like enzyme
VTEPLRVLHIVGGSAFGGGSVVILDLVADAVSRGWAVDVLTTEPRLTEHVLAAGAGVVPLRAIERAINPWHDIRGLWRLVRYLRTHRYDVVHTHTSKAGVLGRAAAWLTGVPAVVHTMHGMAVHDRSPRWAVRTTALIERMASRWCAAVVTVSEWHREWALSLGIADAERLVAIPNGVARPHPQNARDVVRAQLGVAPNERLVLCVSRIAAGKGLEDLVDAVARARANNPECRLTLRIAGDGPFLVDLRRQVHHRGLASDTVLLGHRSDIGDLYAAADLVVHPSHREGLSLALLESLRAGTAVVASAIPTAREATGNGEVAWLFPPGDPEALASTLVEASLDVPGAEWRRAAARSRSDQLYTRERMQLSYARLYRRILLERRGRLLPCGAPVAVRAAQRRDIDAITSLHLIAFAGFFLSRLGRTFLSVYYRAVIDTGDGILLVATVDAVPVGFVAGTDGGGSASPFRRYARRFVGPALLALIRRPSLAGTMVARAFTVVRSHTGDGHDGIPTPVAELASLAVHPALQGRGAGAALVRAFAAAVTARDALREVELTTDAHNNTSVRRFYERLGFVAVGEEARGRDRLMVRYRSEARRAGSITGCHVHPDQAHAYAE